VLWQVQHLTLEYMGYEVEPPFVAFGTPRIGDAGRDGYVRDLSARLLAAAGRRVDRSKGVAAPIGLIDLAAVTANQ
jgi:NAD(P)H dehydrogenase (quinone)